MRGAGNAALTVARSRLAIRRQLATTPGRLRLAAALLALSAIVFGALATHAAGTRREAVRSVVTTERLLVSAVDLSAFLSDAHAAAAFSFLVGGPEPAISRDDYKRKRERAGGSVATLAREVGTSSGSALAVRRIIQKLPVYAGFIDNARANYRQGFPVGSAYLRRASQEMRDEMLPAARELYRIEARDLTPSYRAGVSTWTALVVVLTGAALLALLAATQVYIARATHRIVNPYLALASALLVGLMVWILVAFAKQQNALVEAQHKGSDPVELFTVTRILASRAQANESIALAARGGGEGASELAAVDHGFQAVIRPIGVSRTGGARGSGGLLDQATVITGHPTAAIDEIYGAYRRYLDAHGRVVKQERRGDFTAAVKLAVGSDTDGIVSSKGAADALHLTLDREVRRAQELFEDAASRAGSALAGLTVGIPLLTVLCGLLAMSGVRQRLAEYR